MVMARRQSRQNGSIPMNIKLLPNKCTQCIGNTKTAGTGKHLCGGEILGCQINGNMAAGTDHCENLQIGVGIKKGGGLKGKGKMGKGNKETAAGQNQMKSNLDKITNRPKV